MNQTGYPAPVITQPQQNSRHNEYEYVKKLY